jgi:hypothetical protein
MCAEDTRPGPRDFDERLDEVGSIAMGSERRMLATEGGEVGVEVGTVLRLEGIEPASAGEEPVACASVAEC